jgi:aconitate decarboxylase
LHSAAVALPALWAAAATDAGKVSGRQFLEAARAGYAAGLRAGMALHGAQMLLRGRHSGAVVGTHAAAAGVGKLTGLDPARFEEALGLAGIPSTGLIAALYEAMCKCLRHSFSARKGLYAAVLTAGGYTGIQRAFERDYGGFLSTFGHGHGLGHDPDASQFTADLGEHWEVERIVIRSDATIGGIHSPLDALFDADCQLKAEEITRIEVAVSQAVHHRGWWLLERPLIPIGAQMNIG